MLSHRIGAARSPCRCLSKLLSGFEFSFAYHCLFFELNSSLPLYFCPLDLRGILFGSAGLRFGSSGSLPGCSDRSSVGLIFRGIASMPTDRRLW